MRDDAVGQPKPVDVEARREAVLRMRHLPEGVAPEEFARTLLNALLDQSWRVRKTAVEVLLEEYPPESYIKGLMDLLYLEDNAGARNSAIEALTKLGRRATPYLIDAFRNSNEDVRKFIVDIIGEVRDRHALPVLMEALNDEDENVRASSVEHLGSMEEESVVDTLVEILSSGDLWTAYPAAEALGKIGNPKAVPALIAALGNRALREPALRALASLGDPKSIDSVVPFINDRSKAVQNEAICALKAFYHGGVPEEAIVNAVREHFGELGTDILLEQTQSHRADVKASAILLLGLMKDDRAMHPLLDMALEDDFADDVRKAIVYITKEHPESILPLLREENALLLRIICGIAAEVASPLFYDTLIALLDCEDGHVRAEAAFGLANIGNPEAIEPIKKLLVDPYIDVQEAGVKALGKMKDSIDVDGVINSMENENPVLRKNIVMLLGEIGSRKALEALGFAAKDDDIMVRRAAYAALSRNAGGESLGHLTMALTDEDPAIRITASLALGRVKDEASLESLHLLLKDEDIKVRVAAIKALGMRQDPQSVPRLLESLSDENGFVVTASMDALGDIGGDEAREALMDMLFSEDREFRRTAVRALSSFPGVDHLILPFLRDDDWATRVSVVEALSGSREDHIKAEMEKLYDEEEDPIVRKALGKYLNA